jgi:O-antigen ligase
LETRYKRYRLEPSTIVALIAVLILSVLLGIGVTFLANKELRWIVIPAIAIFGGIALLVVPDKKPILTTVFLLSFQVDIYLRFLYGRAGSNEGLVLPLVIATGVALAGWYLLNGQLKNFELGGSMRRPIFAFVFCVAIAGVFSKEQFVAFSTFIYVAEYYFLYWLAFNIVRTEAEFRGVLKLIFVTLGVQSFVYFVQSSLGVTFDFLGNTISEGEVPRPGGTVSANPAGFVSFIMPALMMVTALSFAKSRRLSNRYTIALMFMGFGAVGLSFTRAAWIGLVFGVSTICFFGIRKKWLNWKVVGALTSVVLIGVLALLPKMLDRVSSDYEQNEAGTSEDTLDERMGLNRIAILIIKDNPLLGIGPGAYPHVFKSYIPPDMKQWVFTVHNVYLLWAAELGIPGGIAFVAIIFMALKIAFRLAQTPPTFVSICATGWSGAIVILSWMMFWVPWIGFSYNAMFWFMLGLMDGAQRLVFKGR